MEWTDRAIILGTHRHGETSLIVSLLTRDHGRHRGLLRGGARGRDRGNLQPGSVALAHWQARLSEHLGALRLETEHAYGVELLDAPLRLACLEAVTGLAEAALPEREPHTVLHDEFIELLGALAADRGWAVRHVRWELRLLADLGFGLDLARCAVTGEPHDLAFVSPRTGRAVSREAGVEYADRLLVFPAMLGGSGRDGDMAQDWMDALALTEHFLARHVLAASGRGLPESRRRLVDQIRRIVAVSRLSTSGQGTVGTGEGPNE